MKDPLHPIHQAYAEALEHGGPAVIPVHDTVLCDGDDTDFTGRPDSGGFLFGSYAIGPCCAQKWEVRAGEYGELSHIRSRCPEGMSFADWVRQLRGPDAAIRIQPGRP